MNVMEQLSFLSTHHPPHSLLFSLLPSSPPLSLLLVVGFEDVKRDRVSVCEGKEKKSG